MMKFPRFLSLYFCFLFIFTSTLSFAQQAPIGEHYGAGSDVAKASTTGGYNLALPVSYPTARGGVPIPFKFRYNASNQVGEGGLGWNIPISYIQRRTSFTHNRPRLASDDSHAKPLERLSLVLEGTSIPMIAVDQSALRFRPMVDSQVLLLIRANNTWKLHDGKGYVYHFEQLPYIPLQDIWLLKEVNDSTTRNPVKLDYQVFATEGPDGQLFPELRLNSIRYNFRPFGDCPKHEIRLAYRKFNSTAGKILKYTAQNSWIRVRSQIVNRIDILARGNSCSSSPIRLRRLQLEYAFDDDTMQPRLRSVDLYGRQGTPEANVAIPVARYQYGSLRPGGISYQDTSSITIPDVANDVASALSSMKEGSVNFQSQYSTRHQIIDFNGDGRMDLLFPKGGFKRENVWIARNEPVNPVIPQFAKNKFVDPKPLFTDEMASLPLNEQVTSEQRYHYKEQVNTENTMVQAIDFNGDGRTDMLDARNKDFWILYLNVPSDGDPNGISWQKKELRTKSIRKGLVEHGQWDENDSGPIPLKRSRTGQKITVINCWDYLGEGDWERCKDEAPQLGTGNQYTRTEWMLSDVNGDGWVDFLVNSVPIDHFFYNTESTDCEEGQPQTAPGPHNYQRVYCRMQSTVDFTKKGNHLQVHYNMAGAQLKQSVQPFTPRVSLEEANCAVEEWYAPSTGRTDHYIGSRPTPSPIGEWRYMTCGLIDVTGDGILDRIRTRRDFHDEAILGHTVAYVGTGQFFTAGLRLPGIKGASAFRNHRDRACGPDAENSSDDTEYANVHSAGLIDITGDGILDFVEDDTVRIGTGTGWTNKISINVGSTSSFRLSRSIETCKGDISKTINGLFDLDGDGRPDYLEVIDGVIHTFQLVGNDGKIGAHNAGRVISIENGFGGKIKIDYTSAKNDFRTIHRVPFKEIVVHKLLSESSEGVMAPALFAYGHAELRFDAARDRWIFPGYGRRIELRGQPDGQNKRLLGSAKITDSLQAEDLLESSSYARYALVGRNKDTYYLDGVLPDSPWPLLSMDLDQPPPELHGQTHQEYDSFHRTRASLPMFDCTSMESPYKMDHPFYFNFSETSSHEYPCLATGYAYQKSVTQWRGDEAPPSDKNIITRKRLLKLDEFGRPLLVAHDNDVFFEEDDICEKISYANSSNSHILNAVHTWQLFHNPEITATTHRLPQTCNEKGFQPISGARFVYDNNEDTIIEGDAMVGLGFRTKEFIQRYDTTLGNLIQDYERHSTVYDMYGNVSQISTSRDSGVEAVVTNYEYDPFKLVEEATSVSSAGISTILKTSTEHEETTLLPLATTSVNGTVWKRQYDGFGRPVIQSVFDPDKDKEFVLVANEYLGWSTGESVERQILSKQFHSEITLEDYLNNAADMDGSVSDEIVNFFDDYSRQRRSELKLGADYGDQVVVLNEGTFDSLGRPLFVADPYIKNASDNLYGTTYFYHSDDSVFCSVEGRGIQTSTNTSEINARFPTCSKISYEGHQKNIRLSGPNERMANSSHANHYSETKTTAMGWILEKSRRSTTSSLFELMEYEYNRLGHAVAIRRFQKPDIRAGEVVWRMSYDSLGQVIQLSEPLVADRIRQFDHWGNLIETAWLDAGTNRKMISDYDVFGRILRSIGMKNGVGDPATEVHYAYDLPSTDSHHLSANNLLGRLSHASSPSMKLFYGYDGIGRQQTITRVGMEGKVFSEVSQHKIDGALEYLSYLTEASSDAEIAHYIYDSAQRVKQITWQSEGQTEVVFDAISIDAFGRYRDIQFGNGSQEIRDFNDLDRREPTEYRLLTSNSNYQSNFIKYDANLRLLERRDRRSQPFKDEQSLFDYDVLYRLSKSKTIRPNGEVLRHEEYEYDGLGNLRTIFDHVGTKDLFISPDLHDRDRICNVNSISNANSSNTNEAVSGKIGQLAIVANKLFTPLIPAPEIGPAVESCAYHYDALGNVVRVINDSSEAARRFTYDGSSRVSSLSHDGALAQYQYGPFGNVTKLDISSPTVEHTRQDRRYGPLMEATLFTDTSTGAVTDIIERRIVGPTGVFLTLRGDQHMYWHSEGRGNRLFTDGSGNELQEVDYRAFGNLLENTAAVGSESYTKYLFNGADRLSGFGVAQMGARLYDGKTGRYLQRDPLLIARTASKTHPYAFAWSDPINYSDPSGLDPHCIDKECTGNGPLGFVVAAGLSAFFSIPKWADGPVRREPVNTPVLISNMIGPIRRNIKNAGGPTAFEEGLLANTKFDDEGWVRLGHRQWIVSGVNGYVPVGYTYGSLGYSYNVDRFGNRVGGIDPGSGLESDLWYNPVDIAAGGVRKIVAAPFRVAVGRWGGKKASQVAVGFADDVACFVKGTLVHTKDGLRPIEEIKVGDKVECADAKTGRWRLCEVVEPSIRHYDGEVITISVNGEQIQSTADHPFWVESGTKLNERPSPEHLSRSEAKPHKQARWVDAGDLRIGDRLATPNNGNPQIVELSTQWRSVEVYNLDVTPNHTYAVSKLGVLVHNRAMINPHLPGVSFGANSVEKFKSHWRIIRKLAREQGVSVPDKFKNANITEIRGFIDSVVGKGVTSVGPYNPMGGGYFRALWTRHGNAIVLRSPQKKFITILNATEGGAAKNIPGGL